MSTRQSPDSEQTVRIAVLGSFTLDLLPDTLGPELERGHLHPAFYISPLQLKIEALALFRCCEKHRGIPFPDASMAGRALGER